jgi:peptidoglycan/xylan/chitin deacetylase (PgdA/CDA1 family)
MFHGVGTSELSEESFRAQISFLVQHFQIVPLAKILVPETTSRLPKLALTFDDGLRNNRTVAYPILCAFRVPATFFVCPGLIESRRWLWSYEYRARLAAMGAAEKELFRKYLRIRCDDDEAIICHLKSIQRSERLERERDLVALTRSFEPTSAQHFEYDLMSWDELRQIDPRLIDIGGHSCYHEILTKVAPGQLAFEVGECKTWLERELGRPVQHFCYPDGAYDPTVRACVSRYFNLAVTVEQRLVSRDDSKLELPRLPAADNLADLSWRMCWPTG